MTSGSESQNALPGLKSVARADGCAAVDQPAGGRPRQVEHQHAGGQQHRRHLAVAQRGDTPLAGRLEVVDGARAQLDGQLHPATLRELVGVQPQRQAVAGRRPQVAVGLRPVEGAALEEHVGGLGGRRRGRQHILDHEVDVRVGVVPLGRHRVRSQERRHGLDPVRQRRGLEHGQLGVTVEPVAGLDLGRGRPLGGHPSQMPLQHHAQGAFGGRLPRRPHRAGDASAGGMDLLVRRRLRRAARTRRHGRRRRLRGCGSRSGRGWPPGRRHRPPPARRARRARRRAGRRPRCARRRWPPPRRASRQRRPAPAPAAARGRRPATPACRCCRSGWRRGR